MIEKNAFKTSISSIFESASFAKRRSSWYLDGRDAIVVVNLQRGWGDEYYINIGFWLKVFGKESFPEYNHCHLYYRLERLMPEHRELILFAGSPEKSNEEIQTRFSEFIQNKLVPFLRECTNEGKLRNLMASGLLEEGLMQPGVEEYLTDGK